jgi:Acetyl-CoA carboxylase, carboxyltransferase component (subunits alpha and beta)
LFSKSESNDVAASFDNSATIQDIVPDNYKQAYDVKSVIAAFADVDSFFEVQSDWGKNVVIGFARLDGEVVGIVANQPKVLAGSLDVDGSDKAGRFVRFCDAFNIPLLALVDVPGYSAGFQAGILGHYPPRCKAPVRLCRSDCSEGDADSAQGLWWCLHRHEQQGRGCRLRVRPPDCPGGRDGCRRCRGNHQQKEIAAAPDPVLLVLSALPSTKKN